MLSFLLKIIKYLEGMNLLIILFSVDLLTTSILAMDILSYITNDRGEKIALQINLKNKGQISPEDLEELEDIISYELLKDSESLDYDEEIEQLLNKKSADDIPA